jgi:hypothetical protein
MDLALLRPPYQTYPKRYLFLLKSHRMIICYSGKFVAGRGFGSLNLAYPKINTFVGKYLTIVHP